MLGWRLLLSALIIPALIGLFYADHRLGAAAPILLVLTGLLAARSAYELVLMLRCRDLRPHLPLCASCAVAVAASAWLGPALLGREGLDALGPVGLVLSLCVLVLFLRSALAFREPGYNLANVSAELLVLCYVGLLLAVTAQLRWVAGAQAGYFVLGSLVVSAKAGDVGGYTIGRLFGRAKLIPRLSPGKTWAGAFGALLFSALGGLAWLRLATGLFDRTWTPPAWYWALLYGLAIGLVGLIGDLCESLIKRDAEVKDSAALMPGFGGLLDLLDSVLYAGPVAYLLWIVLPLRTW